LVSKIRGEATLAPHLSLGGGYSASSSRTQLSAKLEQFSGCAAQLPIHIGSLGIFRSIQGFSVFLAPVVTPALLHLHQQFHAAFASYRHECVPYYLPGAWVPHIALAVHLSAVDLAAALDRCMSDWSPFTARLSAVALVEHPPTDVVVTLPLAPTGS
jgi:hypothetical protein